jgi:hypothetical protein
LILNAFFAHNAILVPLLLSDSKIIFEILNLFPRLILVQCDFKLKLRLDFV